MDSRSYGEQVRRSNEITLEKKQSKRCVHLFDFFRRNRSAGQAVGTKKISYFVLVKCAMTERHEDECRRAWCCKDFTRCMIGC